MDQQQLDNTVRSHQDWLSGKEGGESANLRHANLQGANLQVANLLDADLLGANLRRANLQGADLQGANLLGANLRRANLQGADLQGANLLGADLLYADLQGANLQGANLRRAKNVPEDVAARLLACPETGAFDGWKACRHNVLVRVRIPADARRSSATGRKCRAERVEVLEVIGGECGVSQHDPETIYRAGEPVQCDKWNPDRWNECSGGIHFFITQHEAEEWLDR